MQIVQIQNVDKLYGVGAIAVQALTSIHLDIKTGEMLCIMGASGSGKSTLLNMIATIDAPTHGTLNIAGQNPALLSDTDLSTFRNQTIGFVFQSYNLIPVLTAFENVEYPLIVAGMPKTKRTQQVMKLLEQVGMLDWVHAYPNCLSGGQQQRVAIARALVSQSPLVIADEPTASLDHQTGTQILDLIRQINQTHHTTFVFSTHDPLVASYATRLIRMDSGRIVS